MQRFLLVGHDEIDQSTGSGRVSVMTPRAAKVARVICGKSQEQGNYAAAAV